MSKPTIEELERLLNSEDDTPLHVLSDGRVVDCNTRDTIIEECARVVLEYDKWPRHPILYEDALAVAAAIRALKGKP